MAYPFNYTSRPLRWKVSDRPPFPSSGFNPLKAGFAFLPLGVGVVITAQVTSRLVGRIGPRLPITAGALVVAGGLALLTRISDHATYASDILPALIVLSVGLGLIFFPTTVVAVSGTARHESGLASAVLNVSQQLGARSGSRFSVP